MPKGEQVLSPKQKDRTTTFRKFLIDIFQIGIFSKLSSKYISYWYLLKPSRKLRGEFHSEGVLFSQRKIIWKRGRNFKSWKCWLQSYSYTFDYLQKTLKRFSKRICKNIHVVQEWSKMLNKRKSNPFIFSEIFNWFIYK